MGGAYLSVPKTEKDSADETCAAKGLRVGSSSMQGWRVSQEDAHNAIIDYDENASFFGVYDGHGGSEVALYTSLKLPQFIKNSQEYKNKLFARALEESFIKFDATLIDREIVSELKKLAGDETEVDVAEQEAEVDNLCQEANMPIEQVIAKYEDGEEKEMVKKGESSNDPVKSLLQIENKKTVSPFLRGKKESLKEEEGSSPKNKHIHFDENGDEKHEKEKCEDQKPKEETEKPKINGMKEETEKDFKNETEETNGVKEENKESNTSKEDSKESKESKEDETKEEKENKIVNGDTEEFKDKGKGKGKGKGKSSKGSPVAPPSEPVNELKNQKSKKSADEIYQDLLNEEDEDDEESDDEDVTYGADKFHVSSDDEEEDEE